MKAKRTHRWQALFMAIVMAFSVTTGTTLAADESLATESTVVITGSDFQHPDGDAASAETVKSILSEMKEVYEDADGFLFDGDYSQGSKPNHTESGLAALKGAVNEVYPGLADDGVYVQGNHDREYYNNGGTGLTEAGANDEEDYGVYVINLGNYDRYNTSRENVQKTADALKEYLDQKVAENYNKPIFVLSHIPLHITSRMEGDNKHADLLFHVVNEAAGKGLNVFYLFGHNHGGWDDYLGASSICLTKGNTIGVPQNSGSKYNTETLNFTYMNAGYTGVYSGAAEGADAALTMCAFEITGNEVKISRFAADGVHNVKSKGVKNSNNGNFTPDTKVYFSPLTITPDGAEMYPLQIVCPDPSEQLIFGGIMHLAAQTSDAYQFTDFNWTSSDEKIVTVTGDGENAVVTGVAPGEADITLTVEGNAKASFKAVYTVTVLPPAPEEAVYTKVTDLEQLTSGGQYLIVYAENTGSMQYDLVSASTLAQDKVDDYKIKPVDIGLMSAPETIAGEYSSEEWTFTGTNPAFEFKGVGGILHMEDNDAGFDGIEGELTTVSNADANEHTFYLNNAENYYLCASSHKYFKAYNNGSKAKFYIYKKDTAEEKPESEYVVSINGEEYTKGMYNTKVMLKVPEADGKTFVGWSVDGNIVSTNPEYTFYIAGDIDFTPIYDAVQQEPKALISNVITTKRADGKYDVKFVGQITLPDGYEVEEAGLVWSSKKDTELVLGDGLKPTYITKISDTNQFSVTIQGVPANKFLRGKIFATVTNGEKETIYSEMELADPNHQFK